MALLGRNPNFSDKDFDSLRQRLINLATSAFPEWTDFSFANFGNILLELKAFVGDVLLKYQDNQARESRFISASLLRSMLSHSKLIGFVPKGASAASVDLTFTLTAPPIGDVTIEAGDTFRTLEITDPKVFQALANTVILAGTDPASIVFTVENSRNVNETVLSNNLPNQEFDLAEPAFLDGSLSILAGNGAYTVVDDFLESTSTDRHARVIVNEIGRAKVRFGNGINGEIPQGSIDFDYKVGGGKGGNVDPGTIVRADKSYIDAFGNAQVVTVTNQGKGAGGADRQGVESIRVEAPRSLRVLNRTVSREDYEINALKVKGVARALMQTSNEKVGIAENQGELAIIPSGGGAPSTALKDKVLTQVTVTFPNTLTFVVKVVGANFVTVDIEARVFATATDAGTPAVLGPAIRAALKAFFDLTQPDPSTGEDVANPNADFGFKLGGVLAFSDVYNVIRDTSGVDRMDDGPNALLIDGEASDLALASDEFPVLGAVTLIEAATGIPLP